MRLTKRIFGWDFEFHTGSKRSFWDIYPYKSREGRWGPVDTYGLVWWKFHLTIDKQYQRIISVCADCFEAVEERSMGTEGWTVCPGCGNVEQDTIEMTYEEYDKRA